MLCFNIPVWLDYATTLDIVTGKKRGFWFSTFDPLLGSYPKCPSEGHFFNIITKGVSNMEVSKELKTVVYNKLQREYDDYCERLSQLNPELIIRKAQETSIKQRILNLFTPSKENFNYNHLQSALQRNHILDSLCAESNIDNSSTELLDHIKYSLAKDYANLGIATEPTRLFVDMDGTLAEFNPVAKIEQLYEEGYFFHLEPLENIVSAVRELNQNPNYDVYILSSVLENSIYAQNEKIEWLKTYMPELNSEQVIFSLCGQSKINFVPGGVKQTDILLDDYTLNLNEWIQAGGKPVKVLNGINNTHRNWRQDTIHYQSNPSDITHEIQKISNRTCTQSYTPILPNQMANNKPNFLSINLE